MALRHLFLVLVIVIGLGSCSDKKKPVMSGEDPVEIGDFIDFFTERKVPFFIADTSLSRKEKDSLRISYKVFTQFVPDSMAGQFFGKGVKPQIYPLGRVESPAGENYLFVKIFAGDKKAAFVFVFDKKDRLMDGLSILQVDKVSATSQSASIDRSFSIYKTVIRKNRDGTLSDGKDVYGLGAATGKFSLIMTDPLDDKVTELINPIDTFRRKHKYSADYGTGKMNLVSIRDGRKSDRFTFFIHFEKNKGACSGELKGEAMIKSPTVAEYRQGGDPCVLRFSFTASSVTLKELEGCGAHRGLRCAFDGVFRRKKEPVSKKSPAKK